MRTSKRLADPRIIYAIVAFFLLLEALILVLPVHGGAIISAQATGCASCKSLSLTFPNVLSGDMFVLAGFACQCGNGVPGFPNFSSSHGEATILQYDSSFSGNDGQYNQRLFTFVATTSGSYTVTGSSSNVGPITSTGRFFAAYELSGINATKAPGSSAVSGGNPHEPLVTITSVTANSFAMAFVVTTDSTSQSWSIAPGNDPGSMLNGDTNHWRAVTAYILNPPNSSYHWDLQGGAGTFVGGFALSFKALPFTLAVSTTTTTLTISRTQTVGQQVNAPSSLTNVLANQIGFSITGLVPTLIIVGALAFLFYEAGFKDERVILFVMTMGFWICSVPGVALIPMYIPAFISVILLLSVISGRKSSGAIG
jgi:hypothetical protein